MTLASASVDADAPLFDVTQHGARADGTSDCTAAIAETIEAAARTGGGTILIPPAEKPYMISDSINLHSDNLHLSGTGRRSI